MRGGQGHRFEPAYIVASTDNRLYYLQQQNVSYTVQTFESEAAEYVIIIIFIIRYRCYIMYPMSYFNW